MILECVTNSKATALYHSLAIVQVNCKERTTCTNSSEVEPDLWEDQDQQCSIKYKSK